MNIDKALNIFTTVAVVALVTTLVLPGRQTPGIIREGGTAYSKWISAALGQPVVPQYKAK